jgi:hypothetical protein
MFERVGYLTLTKAEQLARQGIKSETDFDFKASAIESTRLYSQSKKDGGDLVDPFASVVLRSAGAGRSRNRVGNRRAIAPVRAHADYA